MIKTNLKLTNKIYLSFCQDCLHESKEAVYEIFSGHGNMDDLIYFAEIMKDYEKIIGYYIQQENYIKALQALSKQVIVFSQLLYTQHQH
jgi:hypothetical protein